ncbi:MAG: helix-turn-helix domain-containing protein [Elusimicrobia bacterium]|nr:MAG: helix-turn-helix domain-containing protein [Elusimicrobiota bacterium]
MSHESRESASAQSQTAALTCPQCGAQAVRGRARPGRTIRYRNVAALPLPADVSLPACVRCRNEFVDPETLARLQPLLHEEYRRVLQQRVRVSIDALMRHISQRKLELLLGLSQGYLSRLRSGGGNPSPELVSHLALLAGDPAARLAELERYWAEPIAH